MTSPFFVKVCVPDYRNVIPATDPGVGALLTKVSAEIKTDNSSKKWSCPARWRAPESNSHLILHSNYW